MKDIREVIALKQKQCAELKQQIDALTVAASLLVDIKDVPLVGLPTKVDVKEPGGGRGVDVKPWRNPLKIITEPPAEPNHAVEIQKQHISDLRVLIDKSEARENVLLDLVKMVMEEKFFRPTITGPPRDNRTSSAIPPEHLSDVATFDEKEDAAQSEAEGALQKEMQDGLNELLSEHEEAHKEG